MKNIYQIFDYSQILWQDFLTRGLRALQNSLGYSFALPVLYLDPNRNGVFNKIA